MDTYKVKELYERYGQDVYRLALSYLHNSHDAEDICQSVFLKLLEKPVTILSGKEKPWLLKCTANACRNHLKSFWHRNKQELDDKIAVSEEAERDLWLALTTLSPKDRALIHLYYYEGYTQDKIAQILGITRTAVQTRMQRARALLEKELRCL